MSSQLAGCRVLAIDNEVGSLAALTTLLKQWGCVVSQATDDVHAMHEFGEGEMDIVIVDYHLNHGLLGDELLVQLQSSISKPIRAIVVTADRSEVVRKRVSHKGFHLLNKPIKAPRLMALMQYILTAGAR
jgi:CheY-like chemotaxis protein